MTNKCELCGCPVKVVGYITKHYEIDLDALMPSDEKIKAAAHAYATNGEPCLLCFLHGVDWLCSHLTAKLNHSGEGV